MRPWPTYRTVLAIAGLTLGLAQCVGRTNISVDPPHATDLGVALRDQSAAVDETLDLNVLVTTPPSIRRFVPTGVRNTGSAPITIYGEGFRSGATVTINSQPCVSVSVVSPSEINCTVPAAPRICGPAVVAVTNPDHQSAVNTRDFFYGPAVVKFGSPMQSPGQVSVASRGSAADVNRDGKLDLVVPGGAGSMAPLYLYLGQGNGTFAAGAPYGAAVQDAAIGDVTGDGILDMVLADSAQSGLTLLSGRGNGTFASSLIPGSEPFPTAAAIGDYDGDVDLDIGYATSTSSVSILYNAGNGSFDATRGIFAFSAPPRWLQFADMNRDGRPDLVYGIDVLTSLNLLGLILDNGASGREAKTIAYSANTSWLAARDMNGDQLVDAVFAAGGKISVMLNDGAANLSARQDTTVGAVVIRSAVLEDLNADGLSDIVTNNGGFFSYLQGKGGGTYAASIETFNTVLGNPIAVADFDGDSLKDVALVGSAGAQTLIQVYLQVCN